MKKKFIRIIQEILVDKTVFFVSHRKKVLNFCDTIYRMENKKIYV
jgi:ABC-type transport system involved in cytochrome bd biosynthesis fused ATPase/permease subunit